MLSTPLWLSAVGPLVLAGVAIFAHCSDRHAVARVNRAALAASLVALCGATLTALAVLVNGKLHTPLIGVGGVGVSLYMDLLSSSIFSLVSFIGVIVVAYSQNYMAGDPGQVHFTGTLCATLSAVLMISLSGNLFLFTLAWIATSILLNRLLVFYPERQAAILAARKEFIASRVGEITLIAACLIILHVFGSLEYSDIFAGARAMHAADNVPASINIVALLLVVTALLKSAQFPFHGWLIEVMETPTPVSALLHAGIINAGGFLILRFADFIALSLPALDTLAIIGGFTALFGSVVMLTQTSIKVSLAHSTVAQMGFMMLECGLGAFPAALLHILAHSLYKAHAFLASGSVIDIARASWTPSPGGKPHRARLIISIGAVLLVTLVVSRLFGATITAKPGVFGLGAVLLLGLVHLIANGIDERPNFYVVGRTLLLSGLAACGYFGLQFMFEVVMHNTLPATQAARGPLGIAIVACVILSFALVVFLQSLVPRYAREPRYEALYAHLANGLYVNTLANRFVLYLWRTPPRAAHSTLPSGATL